MRRIAYDDFESAGVLSGASPVEGPYAWSTTGTGYLTAEKTGGYLTSPSNLYAILQLPRAPRVARGTFAWPTTRCTVGAVAVMKEGSLADMIHTTYNPTTGQFRTSLWITGSGSDLSLDSFTSDTFTLDLATQYVFEVALSPRTAEARIYNATTGIQAGAAQGRDSRLGGLLGPYVYWQIVDGEDLVWHEVSVYDDPASHRWDPPLHLPRMPR